MTAVAHLEVCDVVEAQVVIGDDGRLGPVALGGHHHLPTAGVDVLFKVAAFVVDAAQSDQ